MKFVKILVAGLLLGAVVVGTVSCGSSKNTTAQSQTHTVARGNISVDITAAGNLALSSVQDLTFDLFYAKGTVGSVDVAVGDTVTKGEVLASLDSSEWNDQIQLLEDALTAAQRDVTSKQRALANAQRTVANDQQAIITAQNQVTAKQLALRQAQLNLETAQYNLTAIADVKAQQDIIDHDTALLDFIAAKLIEAVSPGANPLDYGFWMSEQTRVNAEIAAAQKELKAILAGDSINVSTTVALQVASYQLAVDSAQANLDTANQAIGVANTAVTNAQQDLTFAQQDVANAQSDLDISNQKAADAQDALSKAQAASPDIIAPIDGFVTKVNNAGGDQVLSGAVILQVADPDKFEADILVSEMDISKVKVGGDATISVDAMSGVTLSANVTQISPTATIQSGVVNYSVQVEVTSTVPISQSQSSIIPSGTSGNNTAQLNQALQAAVESGRITQQQADTILKNAASGNFTLGQGFGASGNFTLPQGLPSSGNFTLPSSGSFGGRTRSQTSSVASETVQLRDGMTVTVSIIVASRTNVLLVPSAAITTQGGQSYVNVITDTGAMEQRAVQTGLSDYQNTEITSGLTEGEKISYTLGTTTTTSSSTQNRGGVGIPFIGGR
jgi:multidrug efflux pump subunit AcrA (membrane-fusion protein)